MSDFILAYHAWNDRANNRAKPTRSSSSTINQDAWVATKAEYDELVARFCAPSVVRQGVSYGDDSSHHPNRETIDSVAATEQEAMVRTRHIGLDGFVSEYEYRLVQVAGEWRIASLLYLDEDGVYECL